MNKSPHPNWLLGLQADICVHLESIRRMFKGDPKITIVIRNGDDPGHIKDVVLSDDDAEKAISAIRELNANPAYVLEPTK